MIYTRGARGAVYTRGSREVGSMSALLAQSLDLCPRCSLSPRRILFGISLVLFVLPGPRKQTEIERVIELHTDPYNTTKFFETDETRQTKTSKWSIRITSQYIEVLRKDSS